MSWDDRIKHTYYIPIGNEDNEKQGFIKLKGKHFYD